VLKVTGHLRGASLDPNKPVHIPDHGDFRIARAVIRHDAFPGTCRPGDETVPLPSNQEIVVTPNPKASNQSVVPDRLFLCVTFPAEVTKFCTNLV
jgi:hypothetical protein